MFFSKAIFSIDFNGSIDMPDLIWKFKTIGFKIGIFPLHEDWHDIGDLKI